MQSDLGNIRDIFNDINSDGWDTNSPLKYGFYFFDRSVEKLKNVYQELIEKDYVMENIYQSENDERWILHASKIDVLTPEKLHKRNLAFNELASYCDVELYDGWDVEQIAN